jgi:manganese/zinc/iron transport system substrate-binding protein
MRSFAHVIVAAVATFAGCAQAHDEPYNVVATTAMIGDVVSNVAGDQAEVTNLIGAGIDPHLFRPSRNDVRKLMQADVVFYNGLNLEGKMTETFARVRRAGKPVHEVTRLIDKSYLLMDEESGHSDPHVWMDPKGWIRATRVVIDALADHDAGHAAEYEKRGAEYIDKLEKLHEYAQTSFASIPQQQRVLVTAHDAFNYLARAYALQVEGIQGISTDSEAGLRHIERLVDLLVDRKVAAVFTESSVSDKNIKALIEGSGARDQEVTIGGELFSDAMGESGTYEGTYIGMIDHNVTTITRALGGQAPEKGMSGKLAADHAKH